MRRSFSPSLWHVHDLSTKHSLDFGAANHDPSAVAQHFEFSQIDSAVNPGRVPTEFSGSLWNRECFLWIGRGFSTSHNHIALIKSSYCRVNTNVLLVFSTKMKSMLKTPV